MTDGTNYYSAEAATFGDRVSAAREQSGMTQKQLAKRLGIRVATLRSWEDDLNEPRANRLAMLAGLLNVSITWLINGEGEGMSPPDADTGATGVADILSEMRELRAAMTRQVEQLGRLEKRLKGAVRETEEV